MLLVLPVEVFLLVVVNVVVVVAVFVFVGVKATGRVILEVEAVVSIEQRTSRRLDFI